MAAQTGSWIPKSNTDSIKIGRDLSTTPGGSIYATTPGGTRIVYDRNLLLKLSCSPLTVSPPKNMRSIPGVTTVQASAIKEESVEPKKKPSSKKNKEDADDPQFEMDI